MTDEKRPQLSTYILVILLVIVIGVLYWFFFLKPALARIDDMREANLAEEQEIELLKTRLLKKEDAERRWETARKNEGFLRTKIPEAAALPDVFGALEELIFSASKEVVLNAYDFQDSEGYRFIPVNIDVRGTMEKLLVLLEGVEQFAHQALVDSVRLEEDEKGGDHRLKIDFDLVFYLEEQAEAMGPEEETG